MMDAIRLQQDGHEETRYENRRRRHTPPRPDRIRRVEVTEKDYSLEVYEDEHGDTWVRVRTGTHTSNPIPFIDFIIGNQ